MNKISHGDFQKKKKNYSPKYIEFVTTCYLRPYLYLTNDLTHNVWVIVIHENYTVGKFIF
jgi:hypothetical protein